MSTPNAKDKRFIIHGFSSVFGVNTGKVPADTNNLYTGTHNLREFCLANKNFKGTD